ncbi:hypothetical protein C8F04DRAFT_1149566 [Mycena alexandri]|uniref:F-box domain-containing protein n=1 Tax=Mycena alexandri TaxID=1745969 RepID=A0AAD6WLQ0_9AGAR|nr:hypothetical protein C8F04DRAFT_1149566 [Mycena alexandri]
MLNLPPELMDTIFSLLRPEDLVTLMHTSSAIRQRALLQLLSHYNVGTSQITSGTISLPQRACFLVPIIYNIHPIQKLRFTSTQRSLGVISEILATLPPIPDVLVYGAIQKEEAAGVAKLIAVLSRDGKDPVIIAGRRTLFISHPRRAPPLRSRLWHLGRPHLSAISIILFIWFIGPILSAILVVVVVDVCILIAWLCRRLFGPPWDQTVRIAADLGSMWGTSMRTQRVAVPGANNQFTLVTFSAHLVSSMTIPRLPTLSRAHCVALLTTLDLGDNLTALMISANCNFGLAELLVFLHRHQYLGTVTLSPGAISATAVALDPQLQAYSGRIRCLSAPAAYIPLILPHLERWVANLNISSTTDLLELTRAFDAIAALPADAALSNLTLHLWKSRLGSRRLPWRVDRDVEAEAPLRNITRLHLYVHFKYRVTDTQRISRWLMRFPDLVMLELHCGKSVPVLVQAELAESIAGGRAGPWDGVQFRP